MIKPKDNIVTPQVEHEKSVEKAKENLVETTLNLADPPCTLEGIRLNLGCGSDYKPKFLNVDKYDLHADANWDLTERLPLNDNSVAQIIAYETIEHLPMSKLLDILTDWNRVLKPRGKVLAVLPDILSACKNVIEHPEDDWYLAVLYGNQSHEGQFHKNGFTPRRLFKLFGYAGFRTIGTAYINYGNVEEIFVEATK